MGFAGPLQAWDVVHLGISWWWSLVVSLRCDAGKLANGQRCTERLTISFPKRQHCETSGGCACKVAIWDGWWDGILYRPLTCHVVGPSYLLFVCSFVYGEGLGPLNPSLGGLCPRLPSSHHQFVRRSRVASSKNIQITPIIRAVPFTIPSAD